MFPGKWRRSQIAATVQWQPRTGIGPGSIIQSAVAPCRRKWRFASLKQIGAEFRRIVRFCLRIEASCLGGYRGALRDGWRGRDRFAGNWGRQCLGPHGCQSRLRFHKVTPISLGFRRPAAKAGAVGSGQSGLNPEGIPGFCRRSLARGRRNIGPADFLLSGCQKLLFGPEPVFLVPAMLAALFFPKLPSQLGNFVTAQCRFLIVWCLHFLMFVACFTSLCRTFPPAPRTASAFRVTRRFCAPGRIARRLRWP